MDNWSRTRSALLSVVLSAPITKPAGPEAVDGSTPCAQWQRASRQAELADGTVDDVREAVMVGEKAPLIVYRSGLAVDYQPKAFEPP
jgi:hypothetical protein